MSFDDFSASLTTLNYPRHKEFFEVYPNPTNDFIFIDSSLPIDKIQLIDIRGREVLFWNREMEAYDLSVLENGIYFAKALAVIPAPSYSTPSINTAPSPLPPY